MKKITSLSEEQIMKLEKYKDEYISKFYNPAKEADFEEVKEYMTWIYSVCGLSKPIVILVNSPYEAIMVYNTFFNKKRNNETGNENESHGNKWIHPCYYLSSFNSWISFISFFDNEFEIIKDSELFKRYSKILDLNILWTLTFDGLCIVSKNASYKRDHIGNLHCIDGPAIEFPGDIFKYKLYFINGRSISEEIFIKVCNKEFTFDEFIAMKNEDEKATTMSLMRQKFGSDELLKFLDAVVVDKKVIKHDKKYSETITLFKTKTSFSFLTNSKGETNQPYAWIHMVCPSTGADYLIDTCPSFKDALLCAKWHRPKSVPETVDYQWQSAN